MRPTALGETARSCAESRPPNNINNIAETFAFICFPPSEPHDSDVIWCEQACGESVLRLESYAFLRFAREGKTFRRASDALLPGDDSGRELFGSDEQLIEQLLHRSFGFENGIAMVHSPGQVSVSECNATKRRVPQSFAGSRLTAGSKEEPRLRTQVGMPPTIQYDSGDVPLSIEAVAPEHFREL